MSLPLSLSAWHGRDVTESTTDKDGGMWRRRTKALFWAGERDDCQRDRELMCEKEEEDKRTGEVDLSISSRRFQSQSTPGPHFQSQSCPVLSRPVLDPSSPPQAPSPSPSHTTTLFLKVANFSQQASPPSSVLRYHSSHAAAASHTCITTTNQFYLVELGPGGHQRYLRTANKASNSSSG